MTDSVEDSTLCEADRQLLMSSAKILMEFAQYVQLPKQNTSPKGGASGQSAYNKGNWQIGHAFLQEEEPQHLL